MKLPIRNSNWKSFPKGCAFFLFTPSCHSLLKIPSATYKMGMFSKVRSMSLTWSLNYFLMKGKEDGKKKASRPSGGILIRYQKANANLRFFQKLTWNCLPRILVADKKYWGEWLGGPYEETPLWHKSVCIKMLLYMSQKYIQKIF